MSALPENVVAGGSGQPVAWWSAASPVGGDVVLSGVVLLFVAMAFAFVLYHYFTVTVASRRVGARDAMGATSSAAQQRGTSEGRHANNGGLEEPRVLRRALPVTVYKAKDYRAGEALECAVCLAELTDGEAARFLPRCDHGFHAECIDLWLSRHSTCPLCRVDVDVDLLPAPPLSALPPALPEPANYPTTNLPTNVLFWGSQDAVAVARTSGMVQVHGGRSAPGGASPPLVIHAREMAPLPPRERREGDVAKAQGLARLSSLRRLWSRGRRDGCGGYWTHAPMAANHLV